MKGYDYDLMGAIKISRLQNSSSIYVVKYIDEDGGVKSKTVIDEDLAKINILSITRRKDHIYISMISHPNKYLTYSPKHPRYYEKGDAMIGNAKFVLREQLMEYKHVKALEDVLDKFDTLPVDPVGLISLMNLYTIYYRARLLNDKSGVVVHNKSNTLVYNMLIKLGIAEYRRDQPVSLFNQQYTAEQEKQRKRQRIYKVKSEAECNE